MPAAGLVHFDDYRLDAANAQLSRGQQVVKLSPKALSVLHYLVNRPGQLVTKDELFAAVWPEVVVTEGTMAQCIREVRKALGEKAREPRYVETVYRRGYRFIGQVKETAGSSVSSLSASPPPDDRVVVGRAAELAQLQDWYAQARGGQRQVVFVMGEAGIGKTTVVEACVEQFQSEGDCWVGRGQCIEQYGAGEAYMPVLEALGRLCRGPEGREIVAVLNRYAPTWLVQLPSLIDAAELEALQRKTTGATQHRMLREMAEALEALTVERPLILVLEDLHWSDYSTVELLATLARRREAAQLFVIGTYRPVEVLTRDHPLKEMKQELQVHGRCEELALDFLSEGAVGDYLTRRFGAQTFPDTLTRLIHRHTDGNPLFMVNVTQDLIQREVLTQHDGHWALSGQKAAELGGVPDSLRQLIERQLGQVSAADRAVLEAASVAGVEFSAAAVAAGIEYPVERVEESCEELTQRSQFLRSSGSAEWPDGTVAARYGFIHALHHEVLYQRVTPSRRAGLHQRIGERAETAYGSRAEEIAAELAIHFERGRDIPRAIQYLQFAGENAVRRSANQEAISHLTKGLTLVSSLAESRERLQQELTLQVALGSLLMAAKGWADPATGQVYARARELCQHLENPPELFSVLQGLWTFSFIGAQYQTARAIAEELTTLADRTPDSALQVQAHHCLGCTLLMLGELQPARTYLERGIALYDIEQHRSLALVYGHDPGMACRAMGARGVWILGYPDQALRMSQEAIALGQQLSHPFSKGFALACAAGVHAYRREVEMIHERAEGAMAIAADHSFAHLWAWGAHLRARALTEQGQMEDTMALMRRVQAADLNMKNDQTVGLAGAALMFRKMGQLEKALSMLDMALVLVDETGERIYEAELHRLRGELILESAIPNEDRQVTQAGACFHKAIDIARHQHAKSWELRAATSLARLWQQRGESVEARELLGPVYGWFTEGFETADLQDAKALLDELG